MAKPEKAPKRKPKYGFFASVGYIYRILWEHERRLVFAAVCTVPVSLAMAALALYTPPALLRMLESSSRFTPVALGILGLMLAKLLFDLANAVVFEHIDKGAMSVVALLGFLYEKMQQTRDWHLQYKVSVQKLDERAWEVSRNNHTSAARFPMAFANILADVMKFLLFGTVVSMLHPAIILLLAVGCAAHAWIQAWARQRDYAEKDERSAAHKKMLYVSDVISKDFKYAKDIRLYSMQDSLRQRLNNLLDVNRGLYARIHNRAFLVSLVSFLVVLLRDGAAYAFLIGMAMRGEMDAASFVLYFSAITSLSDLMRTILGSVSSIFEGALQISDFREDMEIENELNHGPGIPVPTSPFTIEFQNVSYRYPAGEKNVLENVSFRIEAGEKIALVGLNGAGKTTLTLLMCAMLLPDEGEILLDGHPVMEYNRDELCAAFGVVPQKYSLLPVSIARNIACTMEDEQIDHERLAHCVEVAGLTERLRAFPNGADTPLNREMHTDGVELSGGEVQKLLLARLLYKNPPCIILDEPTAALDPIAEDRMYRRYNEITAHATAVFISHRLASTRFCDRIFLLDGARFAEVGTHEELMAANGRYRELFDIQSKYYREGGADDGSEQ